jgi:hypothetical protein
MNEQSMSEALDAIHNEAVKLLALDLSPEADAIIELIVSLSRYKHDVRTAAEAGDSTAIEETDEERHRREMMDSDDPNIWTRLS